MRPGLFAVLFFATFLGLPAHAIAPDASPLAASLAAAQTPDARAQILAPLLRANLANAARILALVKAQSPVLALPLFRQLLALLAADPSDAAQKALLALADANPTLVAQLANTIQPAAGPEVKTEPKPFANAPLENPSQLSGNTPR